MSLKGQLLKRLKLLVYVLPYGEDLFTFLLGHRSGMTFRGVFSSHPQAVAAIKPGRDRQYDDAFNKAKREKLKSGTENLDSWLFDHDYPLLFWLSRLLGEETRVLEYGGSIGHFFYSTNKLLGIGPDVRWEIVELPEAVELGTELADERGEERLSFSDVSEFGSTQRGDVFLTAGTLQYVEYDLVTLLERVENLPDQLLIHNLPTHPDTSFWTLQRIGDVELPYRVYSEPELVSSLSGLGYRLVDRWSQNRELVVPFKHRHRVSEYGGYFFSRESEAVGEAANTAIDGASGN